MLRYLFTLFAFFAGCCCMFAQSAGTEDRLALAGPAISRLATDNSSITYPAPKKKKKTLTDSYLSMGLGYTLGLGTNAPYRNGINFYTSDAFPIFSRKAVLDFNLNIHFLFSPNEQWYAKAFMIPQGSVSGVGLGYYDMLTVGLSPVIFNKKGSALTAGAFAGINLIMLSSASDYNGSYSLSYPVAFCYGIKSNWYFNRDLFLFGQLTFNSLNKVTADLPSGYSANTVPVSYTNISVGVAFKFSLWDW